MTIESFNHLNLKPGYVPPNKILNPIATDVPIPIRTASEYDVSRPAFYHDEINIGCSRLTREANFE